MRFSAQLRQLQQSGGSNLPYARFRMYLSDPKGAVGEQWPNLFSFSEDGKNILSSNDQIYQNGEQKKSGETLYTREEGLENVWLQIQAELNFKSDAGNVLIRIADDRDQLLTSFVVKLGKDMTSRGLKGLYVELPNVTRTDGAYRRCKLDLDDISYRTYQGFDEDFQRAFLGDFSSERATVKAWSSVTAPLTARVEEEQGNRFLRIDATSSELQKNRDCYIVNWQESLADHFCSETVFWLRPSAFQASGEGELPYIKLGLYATQDSADKWISLLGITEDAIVSLDDRTYQNNVQVKSKEALYCRAAGAEYGWMRVRVKANYGSGDVTVQISDEAGASLVNCTLRAGLQGGYGKGVLVSLPNLYCADGTYRRCILDLDQISYVKRELVSNSISVGEGGSVTVRDQVYTGTAVLDQLEEGEELTFSVTPEEGKVIDQMMYNGSALPDTVSTVTVVKDGTLTVTFRDDPAFTTPSVITSPVVIPGKTEQGATYTVYASSTGYNLAEGYGAWLVRQRDGQKLDLPVMPEALTAIRATEGKFVFRVFGAGLTGETCYLIPYLTVDGVRQQGEASELFTGE